MHPLWKASEVIAWAQSFVDKARQKRSSAKRQAGYRGVREVGNDFPRKPQGTKASRRVQALIAQVDVLEFRRCPIR
jgi:hypothetical protein